MNKAFREVLAENIVQKGNLSHSQEVTRLYRNGLRLLQSWVVDREIFNDKATELRSQFDQFKNEKPNSPKALSALEQGIKKFNDSYHPDRYVLPYMPGGSKFMRNPPLPAEIVYWGEEMPADAKTGTNTPVHIDMVPITFRPADKPFGKVVDFSKKNYE